MEDSTATIKVTMVPQEEFKEGVSYDNEAPVSNSDIDIVPVESSPKGTLRIKILKIIGYFFSILIVVGVLLWKAPFFLNFVTSDIPEVNDAKLIPSDQTVPDEENGYLLLKEFNDAYTKVDNILDANRLRDDKTVLSDEEVDGYFEVYNDVYQTFLQIAGKQYFRNPAYFYPKKYVPDSTIFDTGVGQRPSLSGVRNLSKLSFLKARRAFQNGKDDEGLLYTLAPLSLSLKMEESNADLIQVLVAWSVQGMTYSFIDTLFDEDLLSTSSKKRLISELRSYDASDISPYINAIQHEYLSIKNGFFSDLETYIDGGAISPDKEEMVGKYFEAIGKDKRGYYHLRPNQFIQMYADLFTVVVDDLEKGCPYKSSGEAQAMLEKYRNFSGGGTLLDQIRMHVTENSVGMLIFGVSATTLSGGVEKQCESAKKQTQLIQKLEESLL